MHGLNTERQVKIGNYQYPQTISSIAFSQSGDLLFVGTFKNFLFVCKFSANMRDEDCVKSMFLGNSTEVS